MAARFKPKDIIALPDGLCCEAKPISFDRSENPLSVQLKKYAGMKAMTLLDGKHVRLLSSDVALLGISVSDCDGYIYKAELVRESNGQWVREGQGTLSLPGNLIDRDDLLVPPVPKRSLAASTRTGSAAPKRHRALARRL